MLLVLFTCSCSTLVNQKYFRESRAEKPGMSYRSEFNFNENGYAISVFSSYFEMTDFLTGLIIPIIPTFGLYYKNCCGSKIFFDRDLEVSLIILSPLNSFILNFKDVHVIINQKKLPGFLVQDYQSKNTDLNLKLEKSVDLTESKIYDNDKEKSRIAIVFRFPIKNNEVDSFTLDGIQLISDKEKIQLQPLNFRKESGVGIMFGLPPG